MNETTQDSLRSRAARSIYNRSSRRGFIAKTGAAVIAFGLGETMLSEQKANAASPDANLFCCGPSSACSTCPGTCPNTTQCPSGRYWTGYRWTCCYGGKTVFCRDCCKNGTNCSISNTCICTCLDNQLPCGSAAARRAAAEMWAAPAR